MNNVNSTQTESLSKEQQIEVWRNDCEKLVSLIKESNNKYLVNTMLDFGGLCPNLAFIRLDALNKADYPHLIAMNSVYLTFELDLINHKVSLFQNGHIYLSKKDKATDRYKYYAMKSMIDVCVDYGTCKKFRKSSYKTIEQLSKKIVDYFDIVMKSVDRYTGGYPYKNGIEEP